MSRMISSDLRPRGISTEAFSEHPTAGWAAFFRTIFTYSVKTCLQVASDM